MPVEVSKLLTKALSPLVGGVGKELSGYLADHVRFFRWKSAIRILNRAKDFCDDENIDPRTVPIKFIIPFLEAASLEDTEKEKTLVDMWASLFASAVTSYSARQAIYIDVLKKLSSEDAKFILGLYRSMKRVEHYWEEGFNPSLWNVNDKQDVAETFRTQFYELGWGLRDEIEKRGIFTPEIEKSIERCIHLSAWRVDFIPLLYDVSVYEAAEGYSGSTSGPIDRDSVGIDSVDNIVSLGLMERFEFSIWYPQRPIKSEWGVRATCSFACLTSLGFDFMNSCLKAKHRKRRS